MVTRRGFKRLAPFGKISGWLIARTHHQREAWACENINNQGAVYYCPRVLARAKLGRRSIYVERPRCLFPGYIFVKPREGQWRFLLGTFGVTGVLMQGNSPAKIWDREVDAIKALEDANGLVVLPKRPIELQGFRVGETLRVADGLFSGYIGIYEGAGPKDCERVLLDYLGRKTTVLIGAEHLEREDAGKQASMR